MDAKTYLRLLVPTGVLTIMAKHDKHIITEQFANPDDAAERSMALNLQGYDVFLQTAQYGTVRNANGNISRAKTNVNKSAISDLDIDAGPGKPYPTAETAKQAAEEAFDALHIPSPTIGLFSGHGVRYTWRFDVELMPKTWEKDAEQLASVLIGAGLVLDKGCTTNITRGIRIPDTFNYKDKQNPARVSVFHEGSETSYKEFRRAIYLNQGLAQYVNRNDIQAPRSGRILKYKIATLADKCPMMEHTIATGGRDDEEPLWMLKLTLLACAEDGREWIHTISEGHPDYDPQETEQKFAYRFNPDGTTKTGPPNCHTFNSTQCVTCRHRNQIKGPARLGIVSEDALPKGYFTGDEGTFYRTPGTDGQAMFICSSRFLDAHLARLEQDGAGNTHRGGQLVMRIQFETPGGKAKELIMPTGALSSDHVYKRILLEEGINASLNSKNDPIKLMLGSWLEHLQRVGEKRKIIERVGWIEEDEKGFIGFAMPDTVWKHGTIEPASRPQIDPGLKQVYHTKGSLEAWKVGAQAIVDTSPVLSLPMASAFASTLMRFTNVAGLIISMSSARSGTGKTTSMWGGASVWGEPQRSILLADDTSNSVLARIGRAPCMPVYWDEIFTQWDPLKAREMIDNIFRLAQGREKSRMRATREIMAGANWQTLICVASNYSLMDAVRQVKDQAQANMARVIEVQARPIRSSSTDVDLVRENYGHAGRVYAAFLSKNANQVAKNIRKHQQYMLNTYFNGSVDARFWAAAMACIDAGVKFASHLDLVHMDSQAILMLIRKSITRQFNVHVKEQLRNAADILMTFLSESRENVCVHDTVTKAIHIGPGTNKPIYALGDLSTGMWQICARPFREWLTRKSYNTTEILEQLASMHGCSLRETIFGSNTKFSAGRQLVYEIDSTVKQFRVAGLQKLGR